eukprot:gene18075-21595_t
MTSYHRGRVEYSLPVTIIQRIIRDAWYTKPELVEADLLTDFKVAKGHHHRLLQRWRLSLVLVSKEMFDYVSRYLFTSIKLDYQTHTYARASKANILRAQRADELVRRLKSDGQCPLKRIERLYYISEDPNDHTFPMLLLGYSGFLTSIHRLDLQNSCSIDAIIKMPLLTSLSINDFQMYDRKPYFTALIGHVSLTRLTVRSGYNVTNLSLRLMDLFEYIKLQTTLIRLCILPDVGLSTLSTVFSQSLASALSKAPSIARLSSPLFLAITTFNLYTQPKKLMASIEFTLLVGRLSLKRLAVDHWDLDRAPSFFKYLEQELESILPDKPLISKLTTPYVVQVPRTVTDITVSGRCSPPIRLNDLGPKLVLLLTKRPSIRTLNVHSLCFNYTLLAPFSKSTRITLKHPATLEKSPQLFGEEMIVMDPPTIGLFKSIIKRVEAVREFQ